MREGAVIFAMLLHRCCWVLGLIGSLGIGALACDDDDANTDTIGGPAATDPAGGGALDGAGQDAAGDADAGLPYIDPDKLGPACLEEDAGGCPDGMACARVSAVNATGQHTCIARPECDSLICPSGMMCTMNEKEVPDVYCVPE